MSLPSRACVGNRISYRILNCRARPFSSCFNIGAGCGKESGIYPGEDGGPDGLNLLNLGGSDESLDLVGLNDDSRSVTVFA